MNPFDLRGPEFLLFYTVVLVVVGVAGVVIRYLMSPTGRASRRITDPYIIALLRGGSDEAIRIAVLSLLQRGLLAEEAVGVVAVKGASKGISDIFERRIVEYCVVKVAASWIFRAPLVLEALVERHRELEEMGLVNDATARSANRLLVGIAIAVMVFIAACKCFIALSRGHSNILFLIIMAGVAGYLLFIGFGRLSNMTARGRGALQELQKLFAALRRHPVAARSQEGVFLAAVFGITALPTVERGLMQVLFPPPMPVHRTNSHTSSCGTTSSSCSSSSSSCSSGGGCGSSGCGGCGSS